MCFCLRAFARLCCTVPSSTARHRNSVCVAKAILGKALQRTSKSIKIFIISLDRHPFKDRVQSYSFLLVVLLLPTQLCHSCLHAQVQLIRSPLRVWHTRHGQSQWPQEWEANCQRRQSQQSGSCRNNQERPAGRVHHGITTIVHNSIHAFA